MTAYASQIPTTASRLDGFGRVKVDPGQTSFFEGREYRTYKELNIASAGAYTVQVVVTKNMILTGVRLDIESGQVRMATVSGGTPSGSFAETLPIFARNNMSVGVDRKAAVAATTVFTAGGTHTGGTELDVIRLKSGTNQGNQSSVTVGAADGDQRGVAAGTYFFRLVAATGDPVVGVLRFTWEERG